MRWENIVKEDKTDYKKLDELSRDVYSLKLRLSRIRTRLENLKESIESSIKNSTSVEDLPRHIDYIEKTIEIIDRPIDGR
jgi:predicted  nucleic acid-binding Zn-ribbon protein